MLQRPHESCRKEVWRWQFCSGVKSKVADRARAGAPLPWLKSNAPLCPQELTHRDSELQCLPLQKSWRAVFLLPLGRQLASHWKPLLSQGCLFYLGETSSHIHLAVLKPCSWHTQKPMPSDCTFLAGKRLQETQDTNARHGMGSQHTQELQV